MNIIGKLLKKEREFLKISQKVVSEDVHIPKDKIALYENGKIDMKLSDLRKLAIYFGKSIQFFLNSEEEENLNVSYKYNKLNKEDKQKIEMAKELTINLYKLNELIHKDWKILRDSVAKM